MLRKTTDSIDAILYTHAHADHICGIDDLRPFNFKSKKRIPVYGNDETIERLLISFGYAFGNGRVNLGVPNLEANIVTEEFNIANLRIVPLHLWHGDSMILGYRINNFAYCTDVSKIPDNTFKQLTNLEVLVVDALRLKTHPTHFSLDEAISAAQKIGANKTYFIHMSHDIDHDLHGEKLPESMNFAYDGLSIKV